MSEREPTQVLLVCANPSGTDRIRVDREERVLRESIQLSPHRDRIVVKALHATTVDDLHRELLRAHFDIVHFSGHGTHNGLVLEDETGRIFVPSSEALGRLFGHHKISAVLLNACFSLSVGRFTAMNVDYTIASPVPIGDVAAIEFSRGFYDALGAGHPVLDAFEAGKTRAELKGLSTDLVLLKRGETFVAEPRDVRSTSMRSAENDLQRDVLLGVVIDTSGSMSESIGNINNETLSRLEGVDEAFRIVWRDLRDRLKKSTASETTASRVRVFSYLFGTRIDDFVDLLSLLRAAKTFDIEREVAVLRRSYEDRARATASQYSGLASLARQYGLGGIVDQVASAAEANARTQIIAEIGLRIKSKANAIGDLNATIEELYELWGDEEASIDNEQLRELLFGSTPMCAVMSEVAGRFKRTLTVSEDEARFLLLISDGMPTDGDPSELFDRIKSSGAHIVTCFVAADDVIQPHVLYSQEDQHWNEGARLMFRAASVIENQNPILKELLTRGWHVPPNAKAFLQINHSDMLREFVDAVTTSFTTPRGEVLPAGR